VRQSNRNGHNISSIQKLKVRIPAGTIALSKRKGSFIEDDMPRDDDSFSGEIKAAISFVMSGVAKEGTESGVGSEFVDCSGREVRVTFVAKDPKMIVRRRLA